jgi:hypothetical protein
MVKQDNEVDSVFLEALHGCRWMALATMVLFALL